MGVLLPELGREELSLRLSELSPRCLSQPSLDALCAHYQELRRWSLSTALIGSGTAHEVLERHYGESLAALPFLDPGGTLLDLGSGAGFPGFVLAAADPRIQAFLVESRQKKWAFLATVARRADVSCQCLHARVGFPLPAVLPQQVNFITMRALHFDQRGMDGLLSRLSPDGRWLLWAGTTLPAHLPHGLELETMQRLRGSRHRRLLVFRRPGP